jgi:hypothetical protein
VLLTGASTLRCIAPAFSRPLHRAPARCSRQTDKQWLHSESRCLVRHFGPPCCSFACARNPWWARLVGACSPQRSSACI